MQMGFCEESKQRHYAMESPAPWKNCHCNPLGSHSKRLSDALSSFVDNLRYCRLSKDTQCCESAKRRGNRRNTTSNKNRNRQKQTGDFDELLLRKHSRVQPNPYFEDENEETETLLQPVVEAIKSKNAEHRKIGLAEVRRLSRDNQHAKRVLAKLGAIPPLISLLDTTFADEDLQNLVLLALLSLANGNNINKAAIVTAGAIPRLIKVLSNRWDWAAEECVAAAFLSLSTLDVNKPVIGSSGAVALLIKILKQGSSLQARKDALEALRNLSVFRGNISLIIEAGVLQALLDMVYNADLIERAVDLLASLIATDAGRNAVAAKPDCLLILVDVLSWVNSPCQDKAISLFTSMACDTNLDLRNTIASSGAVPALLELAILGNSLAQQAAALILDVLKDDVEQESDDSFEDYEVDEDQDDEGWLVHNFFEHNCNDNSFKVHVERL